MDEMRRRIDRSDRDREINETIQVGISFFIVYPILILTIQAMCDIAKDRARKLESNI